MLHLNDSRAAKGSRLDRHEHFGAGLIGPRGMQAVLTHPRLAAIPMYLETPGMDAGYDKRNMDRVRLLIAGRGLPPLPDSAFNRGPRRPGATVALRHRADRTPPAKSSGDTSADRPGPCADPPDRPFPLHRTATS